MKESTVDHLVQRLDRLERQNRRAKTIGSFIVIGVVALLLMGQSIKSKPVSQIIEAEQFIVKDKNGNKRAILTGDVFYPGLFFYDEGGNQVAGLGIPGGWGLLTFSDKHGKEHVRLTSTDIGALLHLWDEQEVFLSPGLLKFSGAGATVRLLTEDIEGGLSFTLTGKEGREAALRVNDIQGVSLSVRGKEGYSAVLGAAQLADARKGALVKHSESSLVLFNKDGKVIWQAP